MGKPNLSEKKRVSGPSPLGTTVPYFLDGQWVQDNCCCNDRGFMNSTQGGQKMGVRHRHTQGFSWFTLKCRSVGSVVLFWERVMTAISSMIGYFTSSTCVILSSAVKLGEGKESSRITKRWQENLRGYGRTSTIWNPLPEGHYRTRVPYLSGTLS